MDNLLQNLDISPAIVRFLYFKNRVNNRLKIIKSLAPQINPPNKKSASKKSVKIGLLLNFNIEKIKIHTK